MTTTATRVSPPLRLPARLYEDWRRLTTPTEPAAPFDPGMWTTCRGRRVAGSATP